MGASTHMNAAHRGPRSNELGSTPPERKPTGLIDCEIQTAATTSKGRGSCHDIRLICRLRARDTSAWREIERWVQDFVRYKPWRIPSDDQDDIVQESLAGVWIAVSRNDFQLRHRLKTFVLAIAAHKCANWVKKLKSSPGPLDPAHDIVDPAPTPDEHVGREIEIAWLMAAIQRLGPRSQEVICVKYLRLGRRTNREIAKMLGIPPGTVAWRLHRSVNQLRELMTA
jgi:RNA polymerase sigma-70 factor, ECF subfamily